MSEADTTALVERLRRDNRRWKRLALCALVLLAITLTGATVAVGVQADRSAAALRAAEEASRAEQQARQDAERQGVEAEQAREQVRRMMYLRNIGLAAREWEQAGPRH
jgi:hypothetical protein